MTDSPRPAATRNPAFLLSLSTLVALFPSTPIRGQVPVVPSASAVLEPPAAFRRALDAGTRSADGRPGSRHWSNRADYRIGATLDPSTARLQGRETVTYRNRSPDPLERILFHLEQNVYAPGARRNRRAPITGGVELGEVRVGGEIVEARHPGSGYYQAVTLLEVPLPSTLPPGGTATVELSWAYTVPPAPTFRNGDLDGEVLAVGEWYPRVAVYDDVYGWDRTPYLGDGEFYLEYGDFDVSLTLPAGWLVGATGTLRNPGEVLTPAVRRRLEEAATSSEVVHVVEEDGRGAGRATAGTDGEMLTWRFTATDVRDFAFSTSDGYVWDALSTGSGVLAQALYRPRFGAWGEAAGYAAFTISTLSEWIGPYRSPQITVTEGPVGGMEYPMIVFNPGSDSPRSVAGVTIHEVAHQWFPMAVGSMEAKHPWMDEGFVSYWDEMVAAALWEQEPPRWGDTGSYLRVAGSEEEVPIMRHTDLVSPYGARTLAAYTKPAVVLGALREIVGEETFREAFQDYYRSWRLLHPQPWDFMNLVERHAGRDLDWFWSPMLFGTGVLDQAVETVEVGPDRTRIVIADRGQVVVPTPVRVTLADGGTVERTVDAGTWLGSGGRVTVEVPGQAVRVELDPEAAFPDVSRENNTWQGR